MLVVADYPDNEMSAEKKPVLRRRLVSPNALFYIALALCLIGFGISCASANWSGTIFFACFAIAFVILRYCRNGWLRALRSIIFFILGLTLGVELFSGFIGMSLAFAFISIPLFILSFWLFLTG
jgi:heme O synthase-like polyprenyltransferase